MPRVLEGVLGGWASSYGRGAPVRFTTTVFDLLETLGVFALAVIFCEIVRIVTAEDRHEGKFRDSTSVPEMKYRE